MEHDENPLVELIKRLTEDLKLQLEARQRIHDQLCQEIEQGTQHRLIAAGQAVQIEDLRAEIENLRAEVGRLREALVCQPRGLGAN
jgi:hypothetical protein